MTTAVERESKVSRVVPRKITVQPQTGDSLPHRLLTGAGVAIFMAYYLAWLLGTSIRCFGEFCDDLF